MLDPGYDDLGATYDSGRRVDVSGEGIDGNDMRRLVVPWRILDPVGGGDLLPGVVEGLGIAEEPHGKSGRVWKWTNSVYVSQDGEGRRERGERWILIVVAVLQGAVWSE